MKKESFYICEECGTVLSNDKPGYVLEGSIKGVKGAEETELLKGEFSLCRICFVKRIGMEVQTNRGF